MLNNNKTGVLAKPLWMICFILLQGCQNIPHLSSESVQTQPEIDAFGIVYPKSTTDAVELPSSYLAAAPELAKSQKPYFVITSAAESLPLPDSRIPTLEFEAAMLSDALVQLLKTVNLQLAVASNIKDKRLFDLTVTGTFDKALDKLAQETGFLYRLEDNVLHIVDKQKVQLSLPPLGFLNDPLSEDPYSFFISDLASILQERPQFKTNGKTPYLEFTATAPQKRKVQDYVSALKSEKRLILYKGSLLTLASALPTSKMFIPSEDGYFDMLSNDAITISGVKKISNVKHSVDFFASTLSGQPFSFSLKCQSGKQQYTIQPTLKSSELQNNLYINNCNGQKDTLTLNVPYSHKQLIVLPDNQVMVLEPLALKF